MDNIKLCSYNCKGFSISKIKHIEELLSKSDILFLQETWLLKSQIGTINQYFSEFNTCGISGMNENVLIQGRRYGGCSFLYKKSLSANVTCIDMNSKRVCCIRLEMKSFDSYVFNVYFPCDTNNNEHLQDYNDVLSDISGCMIQHKRDYCVIAGDLNTDLSQLNSGNTLSLQSFVDNENLAFVLVTFSDDVQYTFTGIQHNHSLIDHYIVSQNLLETISQYYTVDSVDNLSDHLPLFCHLSIDNNNVHSEHAFIGKPYVSNKSHWQHASKKQIHDYQTDLDKRLKSFTLPKGIISCKETSTCSHRPDIATFHDNVVTALNESMLAHISSVKNYHKTTPTIPGWDAEMDYAREESLYWHNIWIQCDRPNSGIIYDIMKKCRSVYHYMLRSLKKKQEKNIKVAISKDSLNTNQGTYWKKVECVRKNNFNTTSVIDGHIGDAEIANHFQDKFRNLYNSVPTADRKLDELSERINHKIAVSCNSSVKDNNLHCHIVNKNDVSMAVKKLKSDKSDVEGRVLSNNYIHGTDHLFMYLSFLFSSMINHGYAPATFLQSNMVPIPKGARANVTDSNMYRSIAISSIMSKILDNVIIEQQQLSLATSSYQFGFKSKASTALCTTMMVETIQYYLEKGDHSVCLLLLDASKAFDKVSFEMLFELLLKRNVCPRIIKLLLYMYVNQKCYVKWANELSEPFSVANGVKQGAVISPLLFSIYIDSLFKELKQLGLGCHVGPTFAGAFGYADDVALNAPSLYALKKRISLCESYAERYHITFNPIKSKLICYNIDPCTLGPICLNKQPISIVDNDKHLGNYISNDIHDRNIVSSVCDLYQRSNSTISDFNACNSDTLDRLHSSFSMHMYGCELWNLSSSYIDKYIIAWRKIKRRIWKIPINSHKHIVHNLSSDCKYLIEKRILKFIHNGLNSNSVCENLLQVKLTCRNSCFADNYRFLSHKYNISSSDWTNNIAILLKKLEIKFQNKIYQTLLL